MESIDDVKALLQYLDEFNENVKCEVCQCYKKILGRIKICGHYSCKDCLKNTDQSCPKCKIFFEDSNIEWDNIITKTEDVIVNLKNILLNAAQSVEQRETKNCNNTIIYMNKTYKVNFVDEQRINTKGETPLHIACKKKRVDDVKNLLEKQTDLNAQDYAGWVPLHEAIESGSQEIVEILLQNGALIDVPGEEYTTPLHKAVMSKNIEIIRLLLKNGANKEAVDFFGRKPHECIKKDKEIMQLFNEEFEVTNEIYQLFCRKKMVPFCYYIEPNFKIKLKQHKIKFEENYNPKKVTHFIIRRTHKISVKILIAMLDGCTIIPQEWIDDYLNNLFFIPIPTYNFINIQSLNKGICKAMFNKLLKLPRLFNGINFYITCHTVPVVIHDMKVSRDSLKSIISAGGGKILHRAPTPSTSEEIVNFPYHASQTNAKCCNYIIFEEGKPPLLMYQMPELKHKPSKWIIDCVVNFTILD